MTLFWPFSAARGARAGPRAGRHILWGSLATAAVLAPTLAHALTSEQRAQLPPDATGRIEQRFREAPTPPPPSAAPGVQVEQPPEESAPDNAGNIPLTIEDLKLTGVTAYPLAELEVYWKDRLGKPGTLGDLFSIAAEITARYRNDGYVLSRAIVPAQEIEDGKVELRVIEGYVSRVIFEGDDTRPDILRGIGENITDVRPIRIADLERYVLLLNDQPGVTASSVLRPSPDQTGAADLIVTVQRDLMRSFATLDNRGTRFVGPLQSTAGTIINSPFGLGDQIFVRGITTPIYLDNLKAFDLNNQHTLDSEGTTLALQLNYAEAKPGFTLRPLRVTSDASTVAMVLAHPFIRSRVENLRANLSFAVNEYKTETTPGGNNPSSVLLHDEIRSLRAQVTWETIDSLRGANSVSLQLSQGLSILGASKPESGGICGTPTTCLSRAVGRPDYTKLNLDVSRTQSLGGTWSFLAAATAQYAFTPLLASEQFGLGGSTFLRSYDPSDIIGDSGIGAKFELQYGQEVKEWYLRNFQSYAYVDLGRVQNIKIVPGEKADDAGISIGIGTRFSFTDWSSGYLEVSQPIMRGVTTEGTHDHFPRIFFALIAKF